MAQKEKQSHTSAKKTYSFQEVCQELKISEATLRNWVRLNKINPSKKGNGVRFSRTELARVREAIQKTSFDALTKRRNKSMKSGRLPHLHLFAKTSPNKAITEALLQAYPEALTDAQIACLLYDCACKLVQSLYGVPADAHPVHALLTPFAEEGKRPAKYAPDDFPFTYVEGEDTLGLLYMTLKDAKDLKASGTYYTPLKVVNALIAELPYTQEKDAIPLTVLDPCCGSGAFLLRLPLSIRAEYLYGCDIDPVAVQITRINLALKFKMRDNASLQMLQYRILCADFLNDTLPFGNVFFDLIIGNPPWGYAYSEEEKLRLKERFSCAQTKSIESADLFIEHALSCLSNEGTLSFILPESVLYVRKHRDVRAYICKNAKLKGISYLGNAFDGVQCPAVTMQLSLKNQWETAFEDTGTLHMQGARVKINRRIFTVGTARPMTADNFHLICDDAEYELLRLIREGGNRLFLKDNAQFALGIVTGSNARVLSDKEEEGYEPILTGSDIRPFRILKPSRYIRYDKNKLQQSAKEELYRAPDKLLYRFVSSSLVFARDREGRLSLNSCNLLIPRLAGYDTAYLMAILNSSVAQFYYTKTWRSIKVLRSYIEEIPIPTCTPAKQRKVMQYAQSLSSPMEEEQFEEAKKVLDLVICSLYGLSADDYYLIRRALY